MTYVTEFPTFPAAAIPAALFSAPFEDVSWHNDTCPSFFCKALRIVVFVDFPDVADRELPDGSRFNVYRTFDCGSIAEDFASLSSDDFSDVERFVESVRAEA